jgi:fermentation-respiration switch protein FrsA (DUF1100 family)
VIQASPNRAKRLVMAPSVTKSRRLMKSASEHPPAGLILRSPFSSLTAVGRHHYRWVPVGWILRDRYATLDRMSNIRTPLLVIAGDRDRIVPFSESRLFDAANGLTDAVILNADHNDAALFVADDDRSIVRFFATSVSP